MEIRVPKQKEARIRQDGAEVLLLLDGRVAFQANWRYAKEIADALLVKVRKAEQFEMAARGEKPKLRSILGIKF